MVDWVVPLFQGAVEGIAMLAPKRLREVIANGRIWLKLMAVVLWFVVCLAGALALVVVAAVLVGMFRTLT